MSASLDSVKDRLKRLVGAVIDYENLPEQRAVDWFRLSWYQHRWDIFNPQKTKELIENDLTRLSLLAIDIADPKSEAYRKPTRRSLGRWLKLAYSRTDASYRWISQVPTAEAMFDFINQNTGNTWFRRLQLETFVPWLQSTMAIPPMVEAQDVDVHSPKLSMRSTIISWASYVTALTLLKNKLSHPSSHRP